MSAILTNASSRQSGTAVASGESRIIASGDFAGSAKVVIEISGDSLNYATVHVFDKPGAIVVGAAPSDSITAKIQNGNANTSIDVSITAV